MPTVPPWLTSSEGQAVFVFLVSLVTAGLVDLLVRRVLRRLVGHTKTHLDDHLVDALHRPVAYTAVLVGAALSMQILELSDLVVFVARGLIVTAGVLLWVFALARVGRHLLDHLGENQARYRIVQPRTLPVFDIAIKAVLLLGASYFLLLAWNVDITGWLASAGIVGIAVGFAAQDSLANLFAGFFIIADAPYKLGDFLVLDSGERGRVTGIGIRSTRLLTLDEIEIIVPNSLMANSKIFNESGGPQVPRRIRVPVGVGYGSDVLRVKELLLEIATGQDVVLVDDPGRKPRVLFRSLDDSAMTFEILAWVHDPAHRGRALDAMLTDVVLRFRDEGIEIPFPQREVRLLGDEGQP